MVQLNGKSLNSETILKIQDFNEKVELSEDAWKRIDESRAVVDEILSSGRTKYAVNTGIGTQLGNVVISEDNLIELNENLIRSH